MCSAHVHFFLLIVVKMCLALICSLNHDALLSLHVMSSIILSISLEHFKDLVPGLLQDSRFRHKLRYVQEEARLHR